MGLTLILAIPTPDVSIYLHHEEQTMQHIKLKLAAAITAALLSTNAMADTWEVTQTTTPGSSTTITQDDAVASSGIASVQAMNATNSATAKIKGTQTAAMAGNTLLLKQTGSTADSTQAANYAKAGTIGDTTGTTTALTQKYTGTATIDLEQKTGDLSGVGNLQAVNAADAATVTSLTQNVGAVAGTPASAGTAVTLTQTTSGANTQAINNINATTALVTATQDVAPGSKLTLTQGGASTGTQAANRAVAASVTGTLTQNVKVGTAIASEAALTQTTTAAGTQALNMASVGTVSTGGSSVQSVKGQVTMKQGDTAKAGDGSLQAGNYLKVTGTTTAGVASATQNFGDGTADLDLQQKLSSAGTVQAGNIIDMGAAEGALTQGTQHIANTDKKLSLTQTGATSKGIQAGNLAKASSGTGSTTKIDQDIATGAAAVDIQQVGGTNAIQAGNLIDTRVGVGATTATQAITTTETLNLAQNGATTSLQAGNAVLLGGTGGGTVSQNGTVTNLALNQGTATTGGGVTGSFQAVNYVGDAL